MKPIPGTITEYKKRLLARDDQIAAGKHAERERRMYPMQVGTLIIGDTLPVKGIGVRPSEDDNSNDVELVAVLEDDSLIRLSLPLPRLFDLIEHSADYLREHFEREVKATQVYRDTQPVHENCAYCGTKAND